MSESETVPRRRLDELPWYSVPAVLLGVPLLAGILVQLDRHLFWDRIVWRFYWGPIRADAADRAHLCSRGSPVFSGDAWTCSDPMGVIASTGYNPVNTVTWALLLGVCIVGIAQILRHLRQGMDTPMVMGASAWVVTGSLWHVAEDTHLIAPPIQYVFITPPVYLLFGAMGILSFVFGAWLASLARRTTTAHAMRQSWLVMMLVVLVYTYLWRREWDGLIHYVSPVWIAAAAAATQLVLWWDVRRRGEIRPSSVLVIYALGWLLAAVFFLLAFHADPWKAQGANAMPSVMLLAPAIAGGITGIVYLVGRRAQAAGKVWGAAFTHPVNLLVVFAQVLDGAATSIGLDLAGYVEKHVASQWLINAVAEGSASIGWDFGVKYKTFIGFLPVKTALAVFVIYVVDVAGRDDARRNPTMIGLVKFAIIMVGLGPGVRDFVRLALGV